MENQNNSSKKFPAVLIVIIIMLSAILTSAQNNPESKMNEAFNNRIQLRVEVDKPHGCFEIMTRSQGSIYVQCINQKHYDEIHKDLFVKCDGKIDVICLSFYSWTGQVFVEECIASNPSSDKKSASEIKEAAEAIEAAAKADALNTFRDYRDGL